MQFKDRVSNNQNRRKLKIVSQSANEMIVDVERADTNVTEAGTPLSANVLNDWDSTVSRVNGYIGKVTRTATVVVGLEASGYTADQVDILIPSGTTDCRNYLQDAINRTPSIGGEVKLLEGEYDIASTLATKLSGILSGCGDSTIINFKGSNNVVFQFDSNTPAGGAVQNMSFKCSSNQTGIFVYIRTTSAGQSLKVKDCTFDLKTTSTYSYYHGNPSVPPPFISFTGCQNLKLGGIEKNIWHNVYVDGVAQYVDYNVGFSNSSSNARYGSYNADRTVAIYTYRNGVLNIRGEIWATNGLAIKAAFSENDDMCVTLPSLPSGIIDPREGISDESSSTVGFTLSSNEYLVSQVFPNKLTVYCSIRNVGGNGKVKFSRIKEDTVIVRFSNTCYIK